jgi:hypothetical protein
MKHSRVVVAFFVAVLVGSAFVGPAAAVQSQPDDLPEESEVGTDFEATFEITELFDEFESWTLSGETELENATWTIRQYDQAGGEISREDVDGATVSAPVDIEDGAATIEVRITGTTPEIEQLSYEPPERFVVANFTQEREGGTAEEIASHEAHHYTQESREARRTIDSASEAVEGSGSGDAQDSLDSAVSAYENGNFENAIDLAERAEGEASQSQLIRNVAIGVGAVIVVAVLAFGGYRVYKSRQQDTSRLR